MLLLPLCSCLQHHINYTVHAEPTSAFALKHTVQTKACMLKSTVEAYPCKALLQVASLLLNLMLSCIHTSSFDAPLTPYFFT